MTQPSQTWDSRVASALGASRARLPSVAILTPVLLLLSVFVLFVAPSGTVEHVVPIFGALGLAVECVYLTHLVFRMYQSVLVHQPASEPERSAWRRRLRRSMLPALNALIGFWIFTLMFYPVANKVTLAAGPDSGVGHLLWLLSVGSAIVGLAFGQLVSFALDVAQQHLAVHPEPTDARG